MMTPKERLFAQERTRMLHQMDRCELIVVESDKVGTRRLPDADIPAQCDILVAHWILTAAKSDESHRQSVDVNIIVDFVADDRNQVWPDTVPAEAVQEPVNRSGPDRRNNDINSQCDTPPNRCMYTEQLT